MFLKNRNISSKIKRSKVTDYAALSNHCICFVGVIRKLILIGYLISRAVKNMYLCMYFKEALHVIICIMFDG